MFNGGKRSQEARALDAHSDPRPQRAPQAGERFKITENEQEAQRVQTGADRRNKPASTQTDQPRADRDAPRAGQLQELNLIVQGDVDPDRKCTVRFLIKQSIESSTGERSSTSGRWIVRIRRAAGICFRRHHHWLPGEAFLETRKLAEREGCNQNVLYHHEAIDEVRAAYRRDAQTDQGKKNRH